MRHCFAPVLRLAYPVFATSGNLKRDTREVLLKIVSAETDAGDYWIESTIKPDALKASPGRSAL
jgi:hypothetical protein